MNHKLATSHFDVVALQETWLNNTIKSEEIIAGTEFTIHRRDRSAFQNRRKEGGGVLTLVNKKYLSKIIPTTETTYAEFIVVKITTGRNTLHVINVYLPPYGIRTHMANELCDSIMKIRRESPASTIVLLGDFNFGKIKWEFTDETLNHLTPKIIEYPRTENNFLRIMATLLLHQINQLTNSKGKWLDLIFTDEVEHSICRAPHTREYIDKCSVHHNPNVVDVAFANHFEQKEKTFNYRNVNHTKFRQIIHANSNQMSIPRYRE